MTKKRNIQTLVISGVLIAMEIVLSRFLSINTWNMKIGFSFVPVVLAAMLCGPAGSCTVAALGDLLGAILFPIGPYFPGFTLTALLRGAVFGLLCRKPSPVRALAAAAVNELLLGLLVNSLWISLLYGTSYSVSLVSRLPQCLLMVPIQTVFTGMAQPVLTRCERRRPA